MNFVAARLPYRQTGTFSNIALDHIDQAAALKPFFTHPPTLQGIQKAIEARKQFDTDTPAGKASRKILVEHLKDQYEGIDTTDKVKKNIELLLSADTFTITTAHQNNLFTGPLYFIYKIVHAIKLADHLNSVLARAKFCSPSFISVRKMLTLPNSIILISVEKNWFGIQNKPVPLAG